ncbi:MAG TPA: tetratricopeptide repeat protein [Cyclobacteriaceae bacterium]|nr:tetratricopeptide repeat protein [Cyclobacteriaceae bacterium]
MRSKFQILALLLSMMSVGAWAQATENGQPAAADSNKQRNEADQKIYQMALRYNDPSIAKARLYDLIERNPENLRYRELLANIYFDMEQFSSAALVAMDILQINDKNINALEIAAYSLEQLGALDRALPHFESLHLLSGDLFSLYKTSYLQYSLKKYDEALNSVNMLIKNKKSEEEMLAFPKKDNTTQEVSMQVAALNLKGLIYREQGNKAEAKAAFDEALKASPDFELAKDNLAGL